MRVLVREFCMPEYLTVFGVNDDITCRDIFSLVESSGQLQRIPKVSSSTHDDDITEVLRMVLDRILW